MARLSIFIFIALVIFSCDQKETKIEKSVKPNKKITIERYCDSVKINVFEQKKFCEKMLTLNSDCEILRELSEMDTLPYACTEEIILKFEKLTKIPSKVKFSGSTVGILYTDLDSLKFAIIEWKKAVCDEAPN